MDEMPGSVGRLADHSLSMIHHSLRASRRRLVVGLLAHRTIRSSHEMYPERSAEVSGELGPTVPVRQLAREITAIEEDVMIEHATGDEYHNVYTSLIQTHLPELDGVNAIKYDDNRKTVIPGQNLLPLTSVVVSTSPLAQMLFYDAVTRFHPGGASSFEDSTDD